MIFLYPITIDDSNDVLRLYEDGTSSVSLTHGTYWAYRSEFSGDWPSLYDQLEADINGSGAGTYHFEATTPDLSNGFEWSSIKMVRDSGAASSWGFDFDVSNTFDPRVLGFSEGSGQQTSTGAQLAGDYSRFGAWNQPPYGAWDRVKGYPTKEQSRNRARRPNAVVTRWGTDEVRSIEIKHVLAGHVRPYLTADSTYSEVSGLASNDFGNAWVDLWDLGVSTYQDIIVIYPDDERYVTDLQLDASGREWEVIYSHRESDQTDSAESTMSTRSLNAEAYDLNLEVGRVPYSDSSVSSATYYRRSL